MTLLRMWAGRLLLFAGIVWRVYDVDPDGVPFRISARLAWDVACGICDAGWPYPVVVEP